MARLVRFHGFRGLVIARGRMQYVWTPDGRRLLDLHTGHGAAFLGHSNPRVVEAIRSQAEELMACPSSFSTTILDDAVDAFSRVLPRWASSLVFMNTGAEAVETALKAAWLYTGRRKIVAVRGSFHGRTLGALSVTWNPRYRRGLPVIGDVEFLDYRAGHEEVSRAVDEDTAAVIVEPVLGEGGVIPLPREFLRVIREVTEERGALMIVDEIQSGFGRTGLMWAHEASGVEPDVIVAGKSIGGGFPVSAVASRDGVLESLEGGMHGSTHAANPLAMAAVRAASEVALVERIHEAASRAGSKLLGGLSKALEGAAPVRSVRGAGLMVGVELRRDPGPVIRCLQEERGILALKAGATTLRMLPPYMITGDDIYEAVSGVRYCICRVYSC